MEDAYRYPIPIVSRFLDSAGAANSTNSTAVVPHNDALVLRNTFVVYGPALLGSFLLFCYVRRRFPRAFNLRSSLVDETHLAQEQYGFISWIWNLNNICDDELLDECGLDSLCFLRLLRMGYKVACFSVLNAIWLMPLYATDPGDETTNDITDRVVRLTVAHVADGSKRLIGTVIAAYFLFGYLMYLIYREFDWIEKRHKYLRKPTIENYSVYVHNIPIEYRSNTKLEQYFKKCFSEEAVAEAKLRIKAPTLQNAVKKRDDLVNKLQHALNYEQVKNEAPTHRQKLFGPKVDSITTYANELKEANDRVTKLIEEIETNTMHLRSDDIEQPAQQRQQQNQLQSKRHWEGEYNNIPLTLESSLDLSSTENEGSSAEMQQQTTDLYDNGGNNNDEDNNNSDNQSRGILGQSVQLLKSKTNQGASVLASTTQGVASAAVNVVTATDEGEFYPAGFVTFRSLAFANAALQMVHHETPFAFKTTEAPQPDDSKFFYHRCRFQHATFTH